jgi:hypothetical protein
VPLHGVSGECSHHRGIDDDWGSKAAKVPLPIDVALHT